MRVRVHVCCLVSAGETLLHIAIAKRKPKLIKYLLDNGANVYAQVRHMSAYLGTYEMRHI
jgi:ankyrin repeat protein